MSSKYNLNAWLVNSELKLTEDSSGYEVDVSIVSMVVVFTVYDDFGDCPIGFYDDVGHISVAVVIVVVSSDDFGDCYFSWLVADAMVHIIVTLAVFKVLGKCSFK